MAASKKPSHKSIQKQQEPGISEDTMKETDLKIGPKDNSNLPKE